MESDLATPITKDAPGPSAPCVAQPRLPPAPPAPPLSTRGAPYAHEGQCSGPDCTKCYKYACPQCGALSNRLYAECWACKNAENSENESTDGCIVVHEENETF